MKASKLPYDMGNMGDLVKHGMLAEFVEWWLKHNDNEFVFLDPFAGRPYVLPPHPEVISRMQLLPDCALKRSQPDVENRYYGSANIVKNITDSADRKGIIKVSDRDPAALEDLLAGGFDSIKIINFNVEESYSIFTCNFPANASSLILIDPYDDFFPKYANKVQANLIKIITEKNIPVLLFVICKDSGEEPGEKWSQFRDWYASANINLMSLSFSHFEKSTVRGEANYNFHSMLLMPQRYQLRVLKELESRIKEFSELLSKVLGKNIAFESNIMRSVAVSN